MKYMEKVYRQRRILGRPVNPYDDGGWVARKIGQTPLTIIRHFSLPLFLDGLILKCFQARAVFNKEM